MAAMTEPKQWTKHLTQSERAQVLLAYEGVGHNARLIAHLADILTNYEALMTLMGIAIPKVPTEQNLTSGEETDDGA